jgi:hypothetical protein
MHTLVLFLSSVIEEFIQERTLTYNITEDYSINGDSYCTQLGVEIVFHDVMKMN